MGNGFALKRIKDLFWILAVAGAVVGVGRFAFGLGASTNMMDSLPWGLWKIFNMVAGAALATSGFIVACVIYIFQMERFRSVARLSVLIGFLGYGASLTALVFDIGLPWRGWHPFFIWNPHSFLFEVFWCVSCYWTITALEMLPIVTERLPTKRLSHFLHEIMLPFVVLGITLSTMHHSSLGSLFLASPTRLHPLWHSVWIPVEFFTSAMGAGLSVIVLVALLCSRLYRFKPDRAVLVRLAGASAVILAIYGVLRTVDFTVHHKWSYVFGPDLTWESRLFWVEISLQVLLPVLLLLVPAVRKRDWGLAVAGISAFLGLVLHRVDVGIVGYFRTAGQVYYPNAGEVVLSLGVIAAAGLVFFFLVEHFHVFDLPERKGEPGPFTRKELVEIVSGPGARRAALISCAVIPLAVWAFREQATGPFRPDPRPVSAPVALDVERTLFRIDGNRAFEFVDFPHGKHEKKLCEQMAEAAKVDPESAQGQRLCDKTCVKCHHLSLPNDHNTPCHRCHRDMEVSTDIFDHAAHESRFGGKGSCGSCHDPEHPEDPATTKPCLACHKENMPGLEKEVLEGFTHLAPGYREAMHGTCITCHRLEGKDPADPKDMGNCLKCHPLGSMHPPRGGWTPGAPAPRPSRLLEDGQWNPGPPPKEEDAGKGKGEGKQRREQKRRQGL